MPGFSPYFMENDIYDSVNHAYKIEEASGVGILAPNLPKKSPASGWKALQTLATGISKLDGGVIMNLNSTPAFIDVFDTAAAVTLGTTVPDATIPIPANATAANGAGLLGTGLKIKIASGTCQIAVVTASGTNTPVTTALYGTLLVQ